MELEKKIIIAWRRFLATQEGKDGMLYLREKTPGIAGAEPHAIIFSAGKVEGYKNAVDTISDLLTLRAASQEEDVENR